MTVAYFKECSSICLKRLRKTTKNLGQNRWLLCLNLGPPKYKAEMLTT